MKKTEARVTVQRKAAFGPRSQVVKLSLIESHLIDALRYLEVDEQWWVLDVINALRSHDGTTVVEGVTLATLLNRPAFERAATLLNRPAFERAKQLVPTTTVQHHSDGRPSLHIVPSPTPEQRP